MKNMNASNPKIVNLFHVYSYNICNSSYPLLKISRWAHKYLYMYMYVCVCKMNKSDNIVLCS